MSKPDEEKINSIRVEIEADPLAATQAEIVAAKTKAASQQNSLQLKNSMAVTTDWVEQAKELGLAVFERQPEENDKEWLIWTTYRQHYPGRMPTWTALAAETHCSIGLVTRTAQKWDFRMRIVEWSNFTDAGIAEARIAAIQELNKNQLEQAQILSGLVTEALQYLDPTTLKPNEIATLMKTADAQSRSIAAYIPEKVEGQVISGVDAAAERKKTDISAVNEILDIMATAGALGNKIVGVEKKTVTTERVIIGGDSNGE